MTAAEALAGLLPAEALSTEAGPMPALGRPPEAVVRPASTDEVATLLSWACREGVGVLPMASGRRVEAMARDAPYRTWPWPPTGSPGSKSTRPPT